MPLAYGTPSEEFGPDSETLRPTLRSAAERAGGAARWPGQRRARVGQIGFHRRVPCRSGWDGSSGKELDGRQRRAGVEQVDALQRDAPARRRRFTRRWRARAGEHHLLLAARFDIEERRAQPRSSSASSIDCSTSGCCSTCWQWLRGCCECARGFFSRSTRSASSRRSSYGDRRCAARPRPARRRAAAPSSGRRRRTARASRRSGRRRAARASAGDECDGWSRLGCIVSRPCRAS